MKIGINLPKYYEDYLQETANLNGLTKSTICGLIVENYLSYNKANGKIPLFQRNIRITLAKKSTSSGEESTNSGEAPEVFDENHWNQMMDELEKAKQKPKEEEERDLPF